MDSVRFDALAQGLSDSGTRRRLLGQVLAVAGLVGLLGPNGWAEIAAGSNATQRKRRQKRKQRRSFRPKFNAFGCVDAGNRCRTAEQCCSGICQGPRGKATCQAHDPGTLRDGSDSCPLTNFRCGSHECMTTTGNLGECHMTTGNAPYCVSDESNGNCVSCARDTDCQRFCGPRAACIRCTSGFCGALNTMCAGTDNCTFP